MTAKSPAPRHPRKSPQRNRHVLTPITDEEIFGAAGMNGSQISFLRNIPPSQAATASLPAASNPATSLALVPTDSVGTDLVGSSSVPSHFVATVPLDNLPVPTGSVVAITENHSTPVSEKHPPVPEAGHTKTPDTLTVPSVAVPSVSVPKEVFCGSHPSQRRVPIACTTVQHGHTGAEHTIYEFLWKSAGKWGRRESDDSRLLRFKQPWLASMVGMHENSIRSILKNLVRKLAIEETGKPGPAQGREIRIFSYSAVLDRRRRAGLIWSIRSHGVTLLTSDQIRTLAEPPDPIGTDIVGTGSLDEGDPVGTSHGRDRGTETYTLSLQNRPPCKEVINISTENQISSSSSAPSEVVRALHRVSGHADDDVARRLTDACTAVAPDAQPHEIAWFIEQKARHGNIRSSLTGFLLTAVPRCFEGDSFRRFRTAAAAANTARENAERENLELCRAMLAEARLVLANPAEHQQEDLDTAESTVRWVEQNHPELLTAQDFVPGQQAQGGKC